MKNHLHIINSLIALLALLFSIYTYYNPAEQQLPEPAPMYATQMVTSQQEQA